MKERALIGLLIILLLSTGIVLARSVDQDGNPLAYPIEPAPESYPAAWPTATPIPTNQPEPTALTLAPQSKPEATKVPPIIDSLPYFTNDE